jgi:hypothetical protein
MVWWWWVVPTVVGVVGLAVVLSGVGWMFRGRPFKGGRGVLGGGGVLAIGAVLGLVGLNVQTYNRLSFERPIASLSLAQVGDRTFDATVVELNEEGEPAGDPQVYRIVGDQWQMDARVITWKPWANVMGLDSQYEVQRIWGRNISGPTRNTANAEDLVVKRPGIDIVTVANQLGGLSPVNVSEREFGSAVFMPMVDGASYNIQITQEGLAVDAGNDIARGALAAGMLQMRAAEEGAQQR